MQWIVDNWLILLLIGGMLAMHLFGHGHGHGKHKPKPKDKAGAASEPGQDDDA